MSRLPGMAAATTVIVAATVGWARPALAQDSGPVYAFCWTPATKQLVYVSAPFQTSEVRTSVLEAAFKTFIKEKYGYSANDGQCSGDQKAEIRDGKRAAVLKQAENGEVTAVAFTYTPPAATASAPAPAPAAPAVAGGPGLDPGNLKDPWLQKAKDELKGSKGYCETNMLLHRIFDCDCFSRMVFRFRVAHAGEYKASNREEGTGWVGFSNILMAKDFVCADCLEDARLTRYVHDVVAENNGPAIQAGRTTPAKVQAHADCIAPKYIAEFRAHPHVFEEQGNLNRAMEKCGAP